MRILTGEKRRAARRARWIRAEHPFEHHRLAGERRKMRGRHRVPVRRDDTSGIMRMDVDDILQRGPPTRPRALSFMSPTVNQRSTVCHDTINRDLHETMRQSGTGHRRPLRLVRGKIPRRERRRASTDARRSVTSVRSHFLISTTTLLITLSSFSSSSFSMYSILLAVQSRLFI